MNFDLEIERIVEEIKSSGAKKVLLQLPDGLKPKATELASSLQESTNAEILIWAGSNFGGCDIPEHIKVDLIVNFGHSEFSPFKKSVGRK